MHCGFCAWYPWISDLHCIHALHSCLGMVHCGHVLHPCIASLRPGHALHLHITPMHCGGTSWILCVASVLHLCASWPSTAFMHCGIHASSWNIMAPMHCICTAQMCNLAMHCTYTSHPCIELEPHGTHAEHLCFVALHCGIHKLCWDLMAPMQHICALQECIVVSINCVGTSRHPCNISVHCSSALWYP